MPRQLVLPEAVDATAFRLLNEWQRGFPLVPRPFACIAETVGRGEEAVLSAYRQMMTQGLVSRVGAVFAPRRLGASALAALAAPPARLEEVAARVSRDPSINHNYQREHRYNLWFVITAASRTHLDQVVAGIERETACEVIVLPLEEEFHIDLGFDLKEGAQARRACGATTAGEPIALANGDEGCKLPEVERQRGVEGGRLVLARQVRQVRPRLRQPERLVGLLRPWERARLHVGDIGLESADRGITQLRWATFGEPSQVNSQPHLDSDGDLVGAHNGNVVNNVELRQQFAAEGMTVRSMF